MEEKVSLDDPVEAFLNDSRGIARNTAIDLGDIWVDLYQAIVEHHQLPPDAEETKEAPSLLDIRKLADQVRTKGGGQAKPLLIKLEASEREHFGGNSVLRESLEIELPRRTKTDRSGRYRRKEPKLAT